MGVSLHANESVRDGLRRIGLEQIRLVLIDLRTGLDPAQLHDMRKRCKMLRALLHLARGGLDSKVRHAEIRRWRDIARALGRARDATVRLDTFRDLVTRPSSCRDLARRLEIEAESAKQAELEPAALKRLTARVTSGQRAWARLSFRHHGWRLLEPGLRESYRETREALRKIRDDSPGEAFHELRKHLKTLWSHVRVLGKTRPKKLRRLAETLEKIGGLLGEDHDLAVLRNYVSDHAGGSLDVLDPLIAQRRRKLHRKAIALARPLFDLRPRQFTHAFKNWWQEWRG